MTLSQILRRIRGRPPEPELTAEQRALVEEWKLSMGGLTVADVDEIERRAIEGHEEEIKQALAESDAFFARHREERRRQSR